MKTEVKRINLPDKHIIGKNNKNITLPSFLLHITNCYLYSRTNLLLDSNGQLIKDAVFDRKWLYMEEFITKEEVKKYGLIDSKNHILLKKIQDNVDINFKQVPITKLDNVSYIDLTHPFGFYAFGHIWDTFQRLYSIEKESVGNTLIAHYDNNRIINLKKYFSIFGYENNNIVSYRSLPNKALFMDQLWYSSNFPLCRLTIETKEWILDKFKQAFPKSFKSTEPKKIYLSRKCKGKHKTQSRDGCIFNEDKLIKLLKQYNFIIVKSFSSLEEAINLFSNAEIVIGPHGAMFNNMIYSKSNCRYIELRSDKYNVGCWEGQSYTCKIKNYHVEIFKGIENSQNFYVDLDKIKNLIK